MGVEEAWIGLSHLTVCLFEWAYNRITWFYNRHCVSVCFIFICHSRCIAIIPVKARSPFTFPKDAPPCPVPLFLFKSHGGKVTNQVVAHAAKHPTARVRQSRNDGVACGLFWSKFLELFLLGSYSATKRWILLSDFITTQWEKICLAKKCPTCVQSFQVSVCNQMGWPNKAS